MTLRWSRRALFYVSSSVQHLLTLCIPLAYLYLRDSFWPRQTCTERARFVARSTSGDIGA